MSSLSLPDGASGCDSDRDVFGPRGGWLVRLAATEMVVEVYLLPKKISPLGGGFKYVSNLRGFPEIIVHF